MDKQDGLETLLKGIGLVVSGIILMSQEKKSAPTGAAKDASPVDDISPAEASDAKDYMELFRKQIYKWTNTTYTS